MLQCIKLMMSKFLHYYYLTFLFVAKM